MLEQLIATDKELMLTLNAGNCHNIFLDICMWMVSEKFIWIPLYVTLLYVLVKYKKKESILPILSMLLILIVCDQISSSIIKPLVGRPRPSHDPEIMGMLKYVYDYKGGPFGFPSSHAANTFGLATFVTLLFRKRSIGISFYLWAVICSYSRIYMGVHYPLDILCGSALGILVGWSIYKGHTMILRSKTYDRYIGNTVNWNDSNWGLVLAALYTTLFCIMCVATQTKLFE
jgi:undecaprenyl-diphosphatase